MRTIKKTALMKNNFLSLLNAPVKKTWWYESNYNDAVKMKNWNSSNLDIVTLGSSFAKYGMDYSGFSINATNWAMMPQNISSDFAILKNYHSYIKGNGVVMMMLCPFSGIVIDYNKEFYDKYHYFLDPILVKYFNEQTLKRISRIIDYPLLGAPKQSIKAVVKKLLGKDKPKYSKAKIDAQNRINSWKTEFSIDNFEDQFSEENLKAIEYNLNLLCEMVDFCKEHSLRPILGIMPATKTLKDHIPSDFMQIAFYNMVEKVKERTGVKILDFYRSSEFENEDLYLDSFLMNEKGRKLFTKKVLEELKININNGCCK